MQTYKIMRMYKDHDKTHTIKTRLSLEEAQAHCRDPETSSRTCKGERGMKLTAINGPWFDEYEKE